VKWLISAIGFLVVFACQLCGGDYSALARITVYWHGEGSGNHASWNNGRLHKGHCAVDPKKIPYGSKVVFPDATCVAVDTGPDVINRKAARSSGRNAAERDAIVVDRFFDSRQEALAWIKAHPHFMTVRILTPSTKQGTKLGATRDLWSSPKNIATSTLTSWRGRPNDFQQSLSLYWAVSTSPSPNVFLQCMRRRT